MSQAQKQKKPWKKPEIRVLDLTPEQKARLFPAMFQPARESEPAK
jgi:hypothetical protein